MEIERKQVKIRDLINGYEEKGTDGVEGVVGYGGKLNIRPAYQREFVYKEKERDEVIRTVLKGFPLNVMYWSKIGDDKYELMDGQQRSISICRYAAEGRQDFSLKVDGDIKYFFNLLAAQKEKFLDYQLDIYICKGEPSEVLEWFEVINIAGAKLTEQELRNTAYTGTWLADAKAYFSKPNCIAGKIAKDYVLGSPIRQEYLETALRWICNKDGLDDIKEYMAQHQQDENASALKIYFKRVIDWVGDVFPVKRSKFMKGVEWGFLYNQFKDADLDPNQLEEKIKQLLMDDDVTAKKGIYEYVLNGNERALSIRSFSDSQKMKAFTRQKGKCKKCQKHFEFEQMEGDHITPWSLGGRTIDSNCQMLCKNCNRTKSGK